MIKISIITPTYNSNQFIERTIKSVLNQTYSNWEYLIVDDNSTDNTLELIKNITKKDPRIKIYKTNHNSKGAATPKNIGIKNAKGKYVAFLDHDDEWLPQKLEKQLNKFEESKDKELGLVSCFVNIRDNKGNLISKYKKYYKKNIIKKLSNGNFLITSSSVMVKLDVLKKIGFFDSNFKISDDWDMWIRISNSGYNFNYISEYLVNYIMHGKNAFLGNNDVNKKNEIILMYKKHYKIFLLYSPYISGYYHICQKKYNLARKYFFLSIFSKNSSLSQRIKSIIYIILNLYR